MSYRNVVLGLVIFCGVVFTPVLQADLTPPPGAPEATMKTLDEVEPRIPISEAPFTITESGSYYFTRNLNGVEGENGITIQEGVDNVTIDLMGYTLEGVEGSLNGIASADNWEEGNNYTVRNGRIVGFGESGIALTRSGSGRIIEDLHISNNGREGIWALSRGIVRNCTITENGSVGIRVRSNVIIKNCLISRNGTIGIYGGRANVVAGCIVIRNTEGISLGFGSHIYDTTSGKNELQGIRVLLGSRIKNCISRENGGDGFQIIGPGGIPGIGPEDQRAVVADNIADGNEGAGISVQRMGARIENNHTSGNRVGIEAESTGNFIVKNSAAGNTESNYEIVKENEVGPIGTMAEVGHHPWANFSFGEPEEGEE